jgi:hypothetical protein
MATTDSHQTSQTSSRSHFLGNPHSLWTLWQSRFALDRLYLVCIIPRTNSSNPPVPCRGGMSLHVDHGAVCCPSTFRFRYYHHISFDGCLGLVRDRRVNLNVARHVVDYLGVPTASTFSGVLLLPLFPNQISHRRPVPWVTLGATRDIAWLP